MGPQFGCDILSLLKQIYLFELKTILNINSLMFFFFCHFFFLIQITVKVKVLTEPMERHGAGGDFVSLNVIDSLSKTVKVAFMPLTKRTKMIRDKFYLLRNVSVGQFVRISETSRVRYTEASFYNE